MSRVDEMFGKSPVTATELQMQQDLANRHYAMQLNAINAAANPPAVPPWKIASAPFNSQTVIRNPRFEYDDDAETITICISKVSNGNIVRLGSIQRVVYEKDNLIDAIASVYTQHKLGVG